VKTPKPNEHQKLVSGGGPPVNRGPKGEARTEPSTPKRERFDIKPTPISASPKPTQEILDFSGLNIRGGLSSKIADPFTATEES
ncbi:phage major capsid protein, partial [Enterobacter hormaechei]|nr:phage major capsid protein [Enterobacter hormaechei]